MILDFFLTVIIAGSLAVAPGAAPDVSNGTKQHEMGPYTQQECSDLATAMKASKNVLTAVCTPKPRPVKQP